MSRAALLALAVAGCGVDLGPSADWTPAEEITGLLAPASGPAPAGARAFDAGGGFRVVTYNVEFGEDPDGIAAALRANPALAQADLILLQEIEAYPGEGLPRAERIADGLGMAWVYVPERPKGDGTHGLAMLSRYPFDAVEVMPLRRNPYGHDRRAVSADIVVGDTLIRVVDVHLDASLNIGERLQQLRPAIIDLPEVALVAGDFNTNPYLWTESTLPLLSPAQIVDTDQAPLLDDFMTRLGFATPASSVGPTERKFGVESRLDAIYPRGVVTGEAHVERDVTGSDHWPVWVDLQP